MTQPTLFGLDNDVSTVTRPVEPWNFVADIPAELRSNKPAYLAWRKTPSTKHLLFSAAEGVNPNLRINKETNPVNRLHGIVGDYDCVSVGEAMDENVLRQAPSDMRPTWLAGTFSGGRRLVYFFEQPVPFDTQIAKHFFAIAERELKLKKLLPGLDPVLNNISQIYDAFDGKEWRKLGDNVLPIAVVSMWLVQASQKTDYSKLVDVKVPLEAVAIEVEKKYPGGWTGAWSIGARGAAFWAGGKNPTTTILYEDGFFSFSDQVARPFTTWGELLGPEFVRKHQADKIGSAVAQIHWDGRTYYRKHDDKRWWGVTKEDLVIHLKVKHGMDTGKGKHDAASEVEKTLHFIQEHRRIAGVIPKLFDPNDIVYMNGLPYLNCATVRPMQSAEERQDWGVNFSWIAAFLEKRWSPIEQADYFFAWWRRAYVSALHGDLLKGQSLFIAGKPGLGKTLLTLRMIGASLGGSADASDFLNNSTTFNKALLESACWTVDDNTSATDATAHRRFGEQIKKLAANPLWNYHAKFKDAMSTEWNGRLCVTLNDDPTSVSIIPDLSQSMEDKILLLRFSDEPVVFPPKRELETTIASEMPFFLKWLADYDAPAHVLGTNRFGVRPYIHEELRAKALHAGGVGDLLEVIALFRTRSAAHEKYGEFWSGTASAFMTEVGSDPDLRPLVSKYSVPVLGRKFREAARLQRSGVEVMTADEKHGNTYRIALKVEEEPRNVVRITPAVEEAVAA